MFLFGRELVGATVLVACWLALLAPPTVLVAASSSYSPSKATHQLVIGVDGGTESIRACCFDATGKVIGEPCAVAYPTHHPAAGWAEQDPADWYENLGQAVRGAVQSIPIDYRHEICALAMDTTCCSVVALDANYIPLRPSLLWMDQRSAPQTTEIMELCQGDPALAVNCGGEGPLSAEWMTPKALWIQQNEPAVWEAATTICEYQDYLNYKLTGIMCASSCNAAARWHWDGDKCIEDSGTGKHPGRPISLYKTLGIPELADKLPQQCISMGSLVGRLTPEASAHLGMPPNVPVIQGGPDAFVGMIGLGCISPGQLCLITGSSHLHCVVTSQPTTAQGTWGAYRGAPLPGINFAEGGQSSTGSIIRWARAIFGGEASYETLDAEAASIAPGSDGLVALETFQGSRTPITDPLARGALIGLTLSHTRAHIWRALMEATCFGTRACIEALARAGHTCDEIVVAGGATRSNLWLQMHADITGIPIEICENADAPLLGSAILACVGVGIHDSVPDAVRAMVRTAKRIEPCPEIAETYSNIYSQIYSKVAEAARPVSHAIANARNQQQTASSSIETAVQIRGGAKETLISPSLLGCDWSTIKEEVHRCIKAGAERFHVDVFDGVFLYSPHALTFGPQMVDAIRRSCDSCQQAGGEKATLDLHMCVYRPARYVFPMAEAGADRFIFQWEAMGCVDDALHLAREIVEAGMKCGISLNPKTDVREIYPLLETGLLDVVDLLAVEPGFGGQKFQQIVLEKIRVLRQRIDALSLQMDIMVDGGVNDTTARAIMTAGANVLVSGSFLFQHPEGIERAIAALRAVEFSQC
jgi:ribulokinase/ribulose-phosphate 3-epimerase